MNFQVHLTFTYELNGQDRPPAAGHLRRIRRRLTEELQSRLAQSFANDPCQFHTEQARITVLAPEVTG